MKTHLVLSGGGIYGVYMLGCLLEVTKVHEFTHISGTSVGAIIGTLMCFMEISDIVQLVRKNKLFNDNDVDISNICVEYGMIRPNSLLQLLQSMIDKYIGQSATFSDFKQKTGKHLYITGTNVTMQRSEVFDFVSTPNMVVLKAIEISISIPCVFTRVVYNNYTYVDGGVSNMYPSNVFNTVNKDKILSIEIIGSNQPREINDFVSYLTSIIFISLKYQKVPDRVIDCISFPCELEVSLIHYNSEDIDRMLQEGVVKALNFLKKTE